MKWDKETYLITDRGRVTSIAMTIFAVGLAASIVALLVDRAHFYHAWLVGSMFWLTLAAGGLFFVMMHHLVGATWSVVLRRIAEAVMAVLPYMILALVPVIWGVHDLYHWNHADIVAADEALQGKTAYLNFPFFVIRTVIYFAVWTILVRMLYKASLRQDGGHTEQLHSRFRHVSAPGMILFAFTLTFAAFDWLMSLDAHWYSTIFGAYIFAGGVVALLAFLPLVSMLLRRQGVMADMITVEHYHDMGKLLFAFVIFWAYMAFSQYFLIWYGNIPEETEWFVRRWTGSWKTISLILVFGNFVIPFFILITRVAKRRLVMLGIFAVWLLFMHWVDLYWVVMPSLYPDGAHLSWIDLAPITAIGGAFIARFWHTFSAHPTVTKGDPKLELSKRLVNY
jgi:hypothetical protein